MELGFDVLRSFTKDIREMEFLGILSAMCPAMDVGILSSLCWIGYKAHREAYLDFNAAREVVPAKQQRSLGNAFVEGFLTNALNPKFSMFYLAAFPQFMTTGDGAAASAFVLVTLHALISAVWYTSIIVLFARLTRLAKSGSFQLWSKGVTGVVFVVSV